MTEPDTTTLTAIEGPSTATRPVVFMLVILAALVAGGLFMLGQVASKIDRQTTVLCRMESADSPPTLLGPLPGC